MASELLHTIEAIGREKGLDPDVIIEALEEAYAAATRKYYHAKEEYGARFDRTTGEFSVFAKQIIVEEDDLADPRTEITIEEALALREDAQLGEVIETAIENEEQNANQSLLPYQRQLKTMLLGLGVLFRQLESATLTPKETAVRDEVMSLAMKVWKNDASRRAKLAEIAAGTEPDPDSEWEKS